MGTFNYCGLMLLTASLATGQEADSAIDSLAELQRLMQVDVQTAALRKQSLQDAPASVTVITASDIRRYGYRTLGEALSGVRGFYMISDGAFRFAGVRGFSLLGDYNMRFLVLINGHQVTDNVYSAMYYFGQDFPLDMDLVDQIEIVRGPTSALYGSNGLFATVNVITKTPANAARGQVSATAGSFGSSRLAASSTFRIGGAAVLLSVSAIRSGGRSVAFPELAQAGFPPPGTGHVEGESGFNTFAGVEWGNWKLTALFGEHNSIDPIGWYGTTIGDTGTHDLESRDFVEAAWHRPAGKAGEVRWRFFYDRYRYDGVYAYGGDSPHRNYDGALGDWVGTQFTFQARSAGVGIVTAGAETNVDLRNIQYDYSILDADKTRLDEEFRLDHRRVSGGLFVQDEITLSPSWTLYLGGRIDANTVDSAFFSPRAMLVNTGRRATYKLMYGRAFRNPSTYERYWEPNPELRAERINTLEFAREQNLHRRINLITSVFHYGLANLIQGVPISSDVLQYRNASRASADGVDLELNGHPLDWLETVASFSAQRSRGANAGERLQNSPARLAQFRASVPLWRHRILLAGAARYLGSRLSAYAEPVAASTLADFTATVRGVQPGLDLQFGVRNLLDRSYSDPLSPEHTPNSLPGAGRNLFVRLTWRNE